MGNQTAGLAGVTAGETAISSVGKGNGLKYRGYDIYDLADNALFEEVAFLLLFGDLPGKTQLDDFTEYLIQARTIPEGVKTVLQQLPPESHPMDILRTGVSALGCIEPESSNFSNQNECIVRMLGILPSMLMYWYHFQNSGARIKTESDEKTLAGTGCPRYTGRCECMGIAEHTGRDPGHYRRID